VDPGAHLGLVVGPHDGLRPAELIGGYGVAEAALAGLEHRRIPAAGASAVVQGFGAMGGSTARYLARAGVRIVGITDSRGMIRNTARGLDVDRLLDARSPAGVIDRAALREDDEELPGDAWLGQDVDLLVPAAVSYTITAGNCDQVRARLIAEAANVPTTPEAERLLLQRGVTVIPDFIANTGAAAGAWWVILGEVVSPLGACSRLSEQIRPLVRGLMGRADETGTPMREAAVRYARENAERLVRDYGDVVALRDLFAAAQAPAQPEPALQPVTTTPPPSGVATPVDALDDTARETDWHPAEAVPAYWPGPADQ
jgi:glutamate dehydrogenase (NAD(P)+)